MFQPGETTSLLQPCIDEALACRDVLAPVPLRPSLLGRLRKRGRHAHWWLAVLALVAASRLRPAPVGD